MAELKPCTHCRRHVAITEVACPFCAASPALEPSASSRLSRVSRAAVFAGAALATAACGGGKNAQPTTQQQQQATPADAGVEEKHQPATPDAGVEQKSSGSGEPVPDQMRQKMPYGAPPARRRLV